MSDAPGTGDRDERGIPPPGRRRFPKARKVHRGDEIREVFRRGKRRRTRHLDVFLSSSPVPHSRVGIVIPKHRRSIVERNLLRRRIREIARLEILPRLAKAGARVDLLIRARPEGYGASYADLSAELTAEVERVCSDPRFSR